MPLTLEWQHRIQRWQEALCQCVYLPLENIPLSGHTTFEHLTYEQALQGEFKPMQPGTAWGKEWEYGWFRGQVTLPPAAAGKRIALRASQGIESLVWINGRIEGSFGSSHKEITLTRSGQAGEVYEILMEAYAGHPFIMAQGPVPFGRLDRVDPGAMHRNLDESSFGVWLEEVYQLALDFTTLNELRDGLDPLALRTAEIDQALTAARRAPRDASCARRPCWARSASGSWAC